MQELEVANNQQTVSSLEVAEMLGINHWEVLRKLEGTDKLKGIIPVFNDNKIVVVDYFIESTYLDAKRENRKCYLFTRKGCEFISNKFTGEKGIIFTAKYIEKFHEMESALNNQMSRRLPITYKEALLQLVEQVEENEKLTEENKVLLPKAIFHDDVLKKDGLITASIIASDLGMTAQKFNSILYSNGIQWKQNKAWCPTKDYKWLVIDGYCDYESYTNEHSTPQLKWTEKGRKWIVEHIEEWTKVYNDMKNKN